MTSKVDAHAAEAGASPARLTAGVSDAKLLLLDQALADLSSHSGSEDHQDLAANIASDQAGNDMDLADLALAAAFDNETDWRSAI
jgi:hypothetical protein